MSIRIGERIGPYDITARIGAGGMGEVYRARDIKLNREVAIKVLPATFAQDEEGVARFRREAQMLASLNHPNIASIYGLEESNGNLALALELVEGEDLAERMKRGPVPMEEALSIAKQIAEGLEGAHEKGIIHRDLKPANIKLTKSGITKILDFGLAKAYEGETEFSQSGASQSPTMAHHRTESGMILGTAAYMSPEQARGKNVDKRADIWAFGVVLYEMLSGKRLFDGETVTDILAAVITREPDLTVLPPTTSPGIRRLLKRCLQRDPKKRLRDIADAYADLEDETGTPSIAKPVKPALTLRVLPWIVAAVAIGIAAWFASQRTGTGAAQREVTHLDLSYPEDVEPYSLLQGGFAVSPDGRTVAMIGVRAGVRRLYVRRLDQPESVELNDTAGVNSVSFSPDNESVAYIPGSTKLTVMSLTDQQRRVVASGTDLGSGVRWTSIGIVFTREGALWIVPPEGGEARQLTTLDPSRQEVLHSDPLVLPGDDALVFSCLTAQTGTERIEALSLKDGKRSVLIERAVSPVWSSTGHLLFGRDGAVFAVTIDPGTLKMNGAAIQIFPSGAVGTVRTGSIALELSSNGTLVFVPTKFAFKRLVSVDRNGSEMALNVPHGPYGNPRVSPDGRRLLFESVGSNIEVYDFARDTRARLISSALGTGFSTWTSSGEAVVFRRFNLPYWASADGSGKGETLKNSSVNDYPASPGPDPDTVITVRIQPETSGDIFLMSLSGKFPPKQILSTPAYEGGPQLSPDQKWLLYQSNESGQPEIYVRRYPVLDRAWQVSEGGGVHTRWSADGEEIFYRNGKNLMSVEFDSSGVEPSFGKPEPLFTDEFDFGQGISIPNYDVTREGRFIMLRRSPNGNSLRAVIHWSEELKQVLAAGGIR